MRQLGVGVGDEYTRVLGSDAALFRRLSDLQAAIDGSEPGGEGAA